MESMLVIGAGRFGSKLAEKLTELGDEVLVVDVSEEKIDQIAPRVTRAQIGDCMDSAVLEELGVRNFDICFVCISDNFQSSMEITSQLKELGARYVVSKTDRELHARLLMKIGADDVVFPERDMAKRTAVRYSTNGVFDYIELSPEYAITEIEPPSAWIGKALKELDLRSRCQINIIGLRSGAKVEPILSPDYVFKKDERVYISGPQKQVLKFIKK